MFMETEGSLFWTLQPATVPYPEQMNSVQIVKNRSLNSTLILSYHVHTDLASGLSPSGFRTLILYVFLIFPYVFHTLLISSPLIRLPL
jgi:hypothetical protein